MAKLLRKSSELEEEVRQRIGAGDYRVTVHHSPAQGWHALIHGNRQTHVALLQDRADIAVTELCQHYQLEHE